MFMLDFWNYGVFSMNSMLEIEDKVISPLKFHYAFDDSKEKDFYLKQGTM